MDETFKSPFFIFKVVEMVLAIIATLLVGSELPYYSAIQTEVVHTAIYAYLLLNIIIILGLLLGEPVSRRLCIVISGSGCIFYILASIILISDAIGMDISKRILSAGLIAVLNSIIFGIDTGYTYIYIQD